MNLNINNGINKFTTKNVHRLLEGQLCEPYQPNDATHELRGDLDEFLTWTLLGERLNEQIKNELEHY